MDKFLIKGPSKIKGQVFISGSKNAALPILASTILFDKPVTLYNLPRVRDIDTMLNLLKSLGSKIYFSKNKKTIRITKIKISQGNNIFTWRVLDRRKTSQLPFKCTKKTWNEI